MVQKSDQQSDQAIDKPSEANATEAMVPSLAPSLARLRLLMLISAATTAVAIAAVLGVIGYRLFAASGSGASTITNGTVFLPQGAHVVSTTIGDGRIVVTLDINGTSEVRIFDLKTLQQIGTLHFAAHPGGG